MAPAAEEPVAKKAKTEEAADKVEPPKELETDEPADSRPAIKDAIGFEAADTTLNVVPVNNGKILMVNADGGMQFLLAGARANVGAKAGRYYYEVSVVELLSHLDGLDNRAHPPTPKHVIKLGFSTAGSSLLLGDTADSIGFHANGSFISEGKNARANDGHLSRGATFGVLLNLDAKSPNANTISLFREGKRVGQPKPLPENLKGKALFPHVTFRNLSLQVHFGPTQLAPLPFKTRSLQMAAKADVQEQKAAKDAKCNVVFPVGFPDEGTFPWLDMFLEQNPGYTELSDRAIHTWCRKSGIYSDRKNFWSMDEPGWHSGLSLVDSGSISKAIMAIAPLVPRNYVLMEVKENLLEEDRKTNLERFNLPQFTKVAKVMMGEPKQNFKDLVHARVLLGKQKRSDADWQKKKEAKERKKMLAQKEKERKEKMEQAKQAAKKKADEMRAAAEAKRKELAEKKKEAEAKKDGAEKKEESKDEKKDVEMKTEEKKEEPKDEKKEEAKEEAKEEPKEEAKEEEVSDDDMGTEPPKVELSEEEKKTNFFHWFKPKDLTEKTLLQSFGKFSIPAKGEGFDKIEFVWQNEEKSVEYLTKWRQEKKRTSRIDNLSVGEWFNTTSAEIAKATQEYQAKQKAFQSKKPKAAAKPKDGDEEKKEDIDLFEVKDVSDIGTGEPLYSKFTFEDWALYTLRYEIFLLLEAFKKDVNDAEREHIPEAHLVHYYQKYFKRGISPKLYGKENIKELFDAFLKDVVAVENGMYVCKLVEDAPDAAKFVKFQEEARRERQRRIDAGDESVRLNFEALKKQAELDKKRAIEAAADAEKKKKQKEEAEKAKAVAAAAKKAADDKAKLDAAKKAALATADGKPAAAEAATATWKKPENKPAPWNKPAGSSKGDGKNSSKGDGKKGDGKSSFKGDGKNKGVQQWNFNKGDKGANKGWNQGKGSGKGKKW